MTLVVQTLLRLPKLGNDLVECADAIAINTDNDRTWRLAIADGASDALFSGLWAKILVAGFTADPPISRERAFDSWLHPLAQTWIENIQWDHLPWFAERKARRGAYATLLGLLFTKPLEISYDAERNWIALAVGDSCVFQVRDDNLIACFPVERSEDFTNVPSLLGTNQRYNQYSLEFHEGKYSEGDIFLLATDALAKWFLSTYEAGEKPWQTLYNLHESDDLEDFITERRLERAMRNDDVTLLIATAKDL